LLAITKNIFYFQTSNLRVGSSNLSERARTPADVRVLMRHLPA
jgi:hypothetical protein